MKLLNAQLINSFVTEVARSKTKYSRVALTVNYKFIQRAFESLNHKQWDDVNIVK